MRRTLLHINYQEYSVCLTNFFEIKPVAGETVAMDGKCMDIFKNGNRFGIWQQIHDQIRHQLRQDLGRDEHSTVAIADSQSVKTTEKKGRSIV